MKKPIIISLVSCLILCICSVVLISAYIIYIRYPQTPAPPTDDDNIQLLTEETAYYIGDATEIGFPNHLYFSQCPLNAFECGTYYLLEARYIDEVLTEDPVIGDKYYISGNYTVDDDIYTLIFDSFLLITHDTSELGLETYTNDLFNFSLDYPSDWSITEDLIGSPDTCESFNLEISIDDYTFGYYLPCASGIAVCIYDNEPITELPEYIEFNDYTEINNGNERYRRSYDEENNVWNVCKYDDTINMYIAAVNLGSVYYYTPSIPELDYLDILDNILFSIHSTN